MKTVIIKMQRPLSIAAGKNPPWLAYDRTRTINRFIAQNDLPSAVVKAMGDAAKRYFEAVVGDEGGLVFGNPVPDQSW